METVWMQAQSLCIVILMIVGISFRRNRTRHVPIMYAAMVWDLILILQIELSRSAILKASKAASNALALNVHVAIAVATVVLYGFMVHSGRKLVNGEATIRPRHKKLGWLTLAMRLLTFATSFLAVAPKE